MLWITENSLARIDGQSLDGWIAAIQDDTSVWMVGVYKSF